MYAPVIGYAGVQPFNDWFTPDTTQRLPLGTLIPAVDPFWGGAEFVYAKASGAITKGWFCVLDNNFLAVGVPNTANQGFPVFVAMMTMADGAYGWFMKSGLAVYKTTATVAAGTAIGITGVGTVGANTAGKQILGVRNLISATGTKTVTAQTVNGSSLLYCPAGYDGIFAGMALSGTGVPASTVAAILLPDGKTINMGSALGTGGDKTATATGQITLTGTYTGYGSGVISSPFAQGAIT